MTARRVSPRDSAQHAANAAAESAHHVTTDAAEFGIHMRQGGWRLGLLVARNVAVSPGRVSPESILPKVNATEFARRAGCSNDKILRHYAAWERAATAGLVPHAADITPGMDVDLDAERLPAWGPIFNSPIERRTATRPPRTAPGPVTTTTADPVTPRPAQVEQTTLDDPYVSREVEAAAARMTAALSQVRDPDHDAEHAANARDAEWTEDVRYAINALAGHARRLADAARDDEWCNTTARQQAADDMRKLSRQLSMIADLATSPDKGQVTDDALSALLNS